MIRYCTAVIALVLVGTTAQAADAPQAVTLDWLDKAPPALPTGVSWGVPWEKGAVQKNQAFSLVAADGKPLPLQTWPLAYWPDGSMKWTGFATVALPDGAGPLKLTLGSGAEVAGETVQVKQSADAIDINTGWLQCHIARTGKNLFESLSIGERMVASQAHLDCILQHGPDDDPANLPARERFTSQITKVTVEQSGPVKAVVKLEGMHKSASGERQFLPFTVRLYFYAGPEQPIRMVHSFVFDGDGNKDFVRGLGVVVSVPMKEEIQNRHVRFGGEGRGVWGEPLQPLSGYQGGFAANIYNTQVSGQRVPNRANLSAANQHLLDAYASWDDFRLLQPNANGFSLEKRTGPKGSWLSISAAKRSNGFVFAGDVSGGLGLSIKDFWQSAPKGLEVRHAKAATAEICAWLWSPDAPAMDMRHYDIVAHGLNETYEDVDMPLATATGVARTHTLTLFPTAGVPSSETLARQATAAQQSPQLVCTPQYLHDVRAFGFWSVQDRSTAYRRPIEDKLDAVITFYQKAVEQYNWYGFWDYGDVMHSYDGARHEWKYDIGGFAWDNNEQGTEMVLWYSFLRTGRADIFRLAEAMTRHCGEVDCYHIGPLAGLGSRHNVRHWGDGAKEARISMAPYRRFYYYLTTDERTGDVMREMLQADVAIMKTDPMRKVNPPTAADRQYPARVRAGPDWWAFVGNWMTEWERTGDTKYRDKIVTGVDSIAAMPYWIQTSQNLLWGFYPETGKLVPRDQNKGSYNLVTNMGGPEIMMELNIGFDNEQWKKMWLQYCRLSSAPANVIMQDKTTGNEGATGQYAGGGRQAGYAYFITKNEAYGRRAIGVLNGGTGQRFLTFEKLTLPQLLRPLEEPRNLNGLVTNDVNQNTLNIIEVLDLCADLLPKGP